MMATTLTKRGKEAEAGDSKDQHALILAVCSKIAGTTGSARADGALNPRLGGQTELNNGIIDDSLTAGVSNGKSRLIQAHLEDRYGITQIELVTKMEEANERLHKFDT